MKWNCRPIKLNGEKKMRECEYMCLYGACVWVWVSVDSIPYATFKKKNPICLKAGQAEDRSIFLSPTIHISPVHILDSVELFFPLTFALLLSLSLSFMHSCGIWESTNTLHISSLFFFVSYCSLHPWRTGIFQMSTLDIIPLTMTRNMVSTQHTRMLATRLHFDSENVFNNHVRCVNIFVWLDILIPNEISDVGWNFISEERFLDCEGSDICTVL